MPLANDWRPFLGSSTFWGAVRVQGLTLPGYRLSPRSGLGGGPHKP
jgi:hypothetical protein